MNHSPELTEVEQPFINQLVGMGWEHTEGSLDDPSTTDRESFRDVLLQDDLRQALHRINLDPGGNPWLDEGRITQAVNALHRLGTAKLLEANQAATELLLQGTEVDGVEGWEGGRRRTVRFIDWDHPGNNSFRPINQFQVACPEGQAGKHIRPDIVLFVNSIPLVIVECKSPRAATPLEEAVNQLQRYANRRRALGVVDINEGSEQLFHYSQFVVATSGEQAGVGTFSSLAVHFLEWKDTSPTPMAEVAAELGKTTEALTSQEKLAAGMLRPAHLLDIVRHFTLFMESGGRTLKVVCRSQQFRAVQIAVRRLRTGKTRLQDGEQDRRGGIIWHTQGSGKSLTMVFLIRKMRSDPKLTPFNAEGPNTFDDDKADPLAFLIVKSMLLTGFDAPVEQVMYLDRHIREAELLQAIARVNRTYARGGVEKGFGIVMDYSGVARHLKDALEGERAGRPLSLFSKTPHESTPASPRIQGRKLLA